LAGTVSGGLQPAVILFIALPQAEDKSDSWYALLVELASGVLPRIENDMWASRKWLQSVSRSVLPANLPLFSC
jgi:hypothetical protein